MAGSRNADAHAAQRARHVARDARPARRRLDKAADHQLGQRALARVLRRQRGHQPAAAQHRDAVRHAQYLVELVADEDHAQALRDQLPQRDEQELGFDRRQHCGRLVEDQDLRAAEQGLQDLDALTLADREVDDQRVRVHLQAEAPRGVDEPGARRAAPRKRPPQRLGAQHHVVQNTHAVGQREVLVHHADAGGQRHRRVARRQRPAEGFDAAFVGNVVPEQDRHQRALARTVLAKQRQHLAAREIERNAVVRHQAAEALGDRAQAQHRRRGRRRVCGAHLAVGFG